MLTFYPRGLIDYRFIAYTLNRYLHFEKTFSLIRQKNTIYLVYTYLFKAWIL